MIMKYSTYNEALNHPYDEGTVLTYNQWYQENYDGFKEDILNDLKAKLIGKTIYIDAKYLINYQGYHYDYHRHIYVNEKGEQDPLEKEIILKGKKVKKLFKIKVKNVEWEGSHTGDVHYVKLFDEDNNAFRLKKIVSKATYDRFAKKADEFLKEVEETKRKKEEIRIKHIHHDPYGEENWED